MNIWSWNCCGSGKSTTIPEIRDQTRLHKCGICFISETKANIQNDKDKSRFSQLDYPNSFTVHARGRSGGLWLGWSDNHRLDIVDSSDRYIAAVIKKIPTGKEWLCTFTYGHPDLCKRADLWNHLKDIANRHNMPWLIVGDLNEIATADEKQGGPPFRYQDHAHFLDFMFSANFLDIGFDGVPFTWTNRQTKNKGETLVKERLDRAICNDNWRTLFPCAKTLNLPIIRCKSDHGAIIVRLTPDHTSGPKPFHFQSMWVERPDCRPIIKNAWNPRPVGSPSYVLSKKLKRVKEKLRIWNKDTIGNLHLKIKDLKDKLNVHQKIPDYDIEVENALQKQVEEAVHLQEHLWRDKSRELRIKCDGTNSRYFHLTTVTRRSRASISRIKDANGVWVEGNTNISNTIVNYFQTIFKSSEPDIHIQDLDIITPTISDEENQNLVRDVSLEEIKDALFSMDPNKAPGPDGFTPLFYQKYWDIIHSDLFDAIKSFMTNGHMLREWNHTNISLIPKIAAPESMDHFRPISLCNVSFRILSKVLANRLKPLLEKIISPTQSAFVKGRLIQDNIVLAHEIIRKLKRKKGADGCMAVKLDMSKAFDRVEWGFLLDTLKAFGFCDKWTNWIHQCISTTSLSFKVNGSPTGLLKPGRGIRQGDPLSPFLFIICAEVLSRMLSKAERDKQIHGIQISRGDNAISHLLFADDSFVFCRANVTECHILKDILATYKRVSGQEINFHKSGIFFSNNSNRGTRGMIQHALGISKCASEGKYLGTALILKRKSSESFHDVLARVMTKIGGWKEKYLSQAGRRTLIKAVTSAIPTYQMSVHLFPQNTCDILDSSNSNFFWGKNDQGKNKMHMVGWDRAATIIAKGGLGFRKARIHNEALIANLFWRLLTNPSNICAKSLKNLYAKNTSFLHAKCPKTASKIWKGLMKVREKILPMICWHVSTGENVDVWRDPWIPTIHMCKPPMGPKPQGCRVVTVSDLIDPETRTWKVDTLNATFPTWVVEEIMRIRLSRHPQEDYLRWMGEKNGVFSVKSAYNYLQEQAYEKRKNKKQEPMIGIWKMIWSTKVAERAKLNLWKALKDGLPVKGNLAKRGVPTDTMCIRCNSAEETVTHALFSCPNIRDTWLHSKLNIDTENWKPGELFPSSLNLFPLIIDRMVSLTQSKVAKVEKLSYIAALTYAIWTDRNNLKHNNKKPWEAHTLQETENLLIKTDNRFQKPNQVDWPQISSNKTYITTDASWSDPNIDASIGFALWDYSGVCLSAGFSTIRAADAQEAEARGVMGGLQLALELGFREVAMLSDCQTLVSFLRDGSTALSWGATTVAHDIFHLSSSFDSCSFDFISREFNVVADVLARAGKLLGSYVCFDPAQVLPLFNYCKSSVSPRRS